MRCNPAAETKCTRAEKNAQRLQHPPTLEELWVIEGSEKIKKRCARWTRPLFPPWSVAPSHNLLHGGTHKLYHLHIIAMVCGTGRPWAAPRCSWTRSCAARCGTPSWRVILGTSITCSAKTVEDLKDIHRLVHHLRHRVSSSGTTGTQSTSCSTECRRTRSCGPDTGVSLSGRGAPTASTSSTSIAKYTAPAAWGWGCVLDRGRVVQLVILLPLPGLLLSPWGSVVVKTWPGPQRSTAARVATTSGVVDAYATEQLLWRAASWGPPW